MCQFLIHLEISSGGSLWFQPHLKVCVLYIECGLITAEGSSYKEQSHNARNIQQYPQHPAYSQHETPISKTTIYIDQNQIRMAQNINNLQYVHMANPQQVPPPGQTYQLPPNSLAGHIGIGRSNPGGRSTTEHKLNMGFLMDNPGKAQYNAWRNIVKDLIMARNFVPGATAMNYPDANFQPIFASRRRLGPVCDQLATASAANNQQRIQDIDEVVIDIVKDCARKLFNTWMTHPHAPRQGQPGAPFAQVIVRGFCYQRTIQLSGVLQRLCRTYRMHLLHRRSIKRKHLRSTKPTTCSTYEQPSPSTCSTCHQPSASTCSTCHQPSASSSSTS